LVLHEKGEKSEWREWVGWICEAFFKRTKRDLWKQVEI